MTIDPNKEATVEVDGIYWTLSIGGVNLSYERRLMVQSITIEESVKGSDSMTVMINDPDLEFAQDDLYLQDIPISCDMNFHGSSEKHCFYGYISEISVTFPEQGSTTVELYCLDKTHLMQRVKNTQTWDNVRSIDVVREKCNGYGFKLVYQEDYEYIEQESISQSSQTDIEFLEQLAGDEREIFVAKLVGDTFFYIKLGLLAEPAFNLYYRVDSFHSNVLSFAPNIDKESRQADVRYADIRTSDKDTESFYANQATVALETQGYPVDMSTVYYGSVAYDDTPIRKAKEESTEDGTYYVLDRTQKNNKAPDIPVLDKNKPSDAVIDTPWTDEFEGVQTFSMRSAIMPIDEVDDTEDTENSDASDPKPTGKGTITIPPISEIKGQSGGSIFLSAPLKADNVEGGSDVNSVESSAAEREYREIEYNTLRGEAQLMPTMELMGLRYMQTVNFNGLGKYLSGAYFVESVRRTLDTSIGYSLNVTLIKTGFGKSMKESVVPEALKVSDEFEGFKVGDEVKITDPNAHWEYTDELRRSKHMAEKKVKNFVLGLPWKITAINRELRIVELRALKQWISIDYIEKV